MRADKYIEQRENERVCDGFTLRRTDPFGFWVVEFPKGKTPAELVGSSFTTADAARKAAEALRNK